MTADQYAKLGLLDVIMDTTDIFSNILHVVRPPPTLKGTKRSVVKGRAEPIDKGNQAKVGKEQVGVDELDER